MQNPYGEQTSVGRLITAVSTFTRPANTTQYSGARVVSRSTSTGTLIEIPNCVPENGGSGYIVEASLSTNVKSLTFKSRIHLLNSSAATVSPDNTAWREMWADIGIRLRSFDLPAMATAPDTSNSDMSRSFDSTLRKPFVCAAGSTSLWWSLETLDTWTPASGQKFWLTLLIDL